MHESELWITRIFNDHLAWLGNALLNFANSVLSLLHIHANLHPEARPWANYITMQVMVALVVIVTVALLRPRLSSDRPGKFQHTMELIYDFVHGQGEEQVGHAAARYLAFFGTIFVFVLVCNLIGIIPGFESPTMTPAVPFGCALAVFLYYNLMGVQANGLFRYLRNFAGPMIALAPLMIPIEIVSHIARLLSLTVRLTANIYAGEQITLIFLRLTFFLFPVAFMGLHIFVGVLQAYVFMLLTMMYVAGAVAHEH